MFLGPGHIGNFLLLLFPNKPVFQCIPYGKHQSGKKLPNCSLLLVSNKKIHLMIVFFKNLKQENTSDVARPYKGYSRFVIKS